MDSEGRVLLSIFSTRQSDRGYRRDAIPKAALDRCIEAARLAPSANNGQPWEFVLVGDEETRNRLANAARFGIVGGNKFVADAPVIVAVLETPGHRLTRLGGKIIRRDFPLMDLGMAVENFCLQASAEGLGTCILGLFLAGQVRRAIKSPRKHRIRLLISVGWPTDPEVRNKKRKPKEDISRYILGRGILDGT